MFTAASTLVLCALACNVFAATIPRVRSINNCTGDVSTITVGDKDYQGYRPQILGDQGWETWTFALPGTVNNSLSVFTWTRGDPASPSSNPNDLGSFSVIASHVGFSATVQEKFVYTQDDDILTFSVGDNHLVFDGTSVPFGVWNISVNIDGLEMNVTTVPIPPDVPFAPTYKGVASQLVDGYFTNVAVTRAHTDGPLKYPSGEIWQVHDVTTIRHTYAKKPIQTLVSSYVRGTTYVLLSALQWFQAENVHHEKVNAAQLAIGLTDTNIPLTYQATDDPSVFKISTTGLNTTVTFPGCDATQENPFVLAGFPIAYRGAFVDSAGGKTEYYSTQTNASLWSNGSLYVGNNSQGIIEVYTRHS